MKILLIYPPFQVGKGMGKVMLSPPLSLLTLAGAVSDLGHEIEILDMNVDYNYDIDKLTLKIKQFDLVGITCMTNTFKTVLNICKIAKKCNIPTILGGFHPTLVPNIIEDFKCIDMICRGEGEVTFRELLKGKPKNQILGLSFRENGAVIHNPDRPFKNNLNRLPFPKNDLVDPKPYHYIWVPAWVCETSRGCPFNCNFCCVTQFHKGKYRTKSPNRVIRELLQLPNTTKLVFFTDDNFSLQKKRIIRICELLEKTKLSKRLMFVCQSRVDDIANNPDMVQAMSKAGFICFFLGFESFKQISLNNMQKQYNLDKVRKCIKICHKNGIMVFGSFIIGNIGETVEDTWKTFKLMKDLEIDMMMTNPITPFPATPLYDEAVKNGWIPEDFRWEKWDITPVMNTPDMTIDQIQDLLDESYRFFYNDIGYFLFGKKLLRLLFNPKFWWYRHVAFSVLTNGLTKFLIKLD
ncbi:MAG: radical SAM protein [Promethearchaeota archaeon]|nr:MAG: radical SAM protein [Candidatus Lokiarchaeota archaeon]